MEISVRVPSALRELVGGAGVVPVEVEPPATVATVLDALAREHSVLERRVRDELGRLRVHVNLFVDSDSVRDLDGLRTPVAAGQELSIIPAISGG
jgi:sulfur-carrier protein